MSFLSKAALSYFGASFLIFVGLFLRLYNFQGYSFGFDQVQILQNSKNINTGHLTLIGPRTGPAPMFTGPLIYYLNALSLFFINSPYSLVLTNAGMALVTGATLFFLGKRYLAHLPLLAQHIPLVIWALSPFLVSLDRTVWNPSLTLLSASLFFFPFLKQSVLEPVDYALIALGAFLSYQAHFTLLLMPVLALPLILKIPTSKSSLLKSIGIGYFLTLLPVILFDLRHEWLNLKGFSSFLISRDQAQHSFLYLFWDTLGISLETAGKLVSDFRGSISSILLGILLITSAFIFSQDRKDRIVIFSCSKWMLATILFFSFYQGQKPEYYFLILIPSFMALIAHMVSRVKRNILTCTVGAVIVAVLSYVNWQFIQPNSTFSLGNQLNVVESLKNINAKQPISVELAVPFGMHFGLEYLVKESQFPMQGIKTVIQYPSPSMENHQNFNGLYLSRQDE